MTIVGYGLFAVAAAIVFASLMFHRDVVKVYYPKKPKCAPNGCCQEIVENKPSLAEQWTDMEDELEDDLR